MSGGNPYVTLSPNTLSLMNVIIDQAEKFVSQIYVIVQNPWELPSGPLNAPIQISTKNSGTVANIGYGSTLEDMNSLMGVLQAFEMSSQVNINGTTQSFSGSVFQIAQQIAIASGDSSVPTVTSIVNTLSSITSSDAAFGADLDESAQQIAQSITADLDSALGYYITGMFPPVENLGAPIPPPSGVSVNLTLTERQAQSVVDSFITGLSTQESSATLGSILTISGKSPATAAAILKAYNASAVKLSVASLGSLTSGATIPGMGPNSLQWIAIIDAAYLGWGTHASAATTKIGAAMAADDPAEAWYELRYVVGNPSTTLPGVYTRDFENAAIFGLNGANMDSYAQATSDYAVLTENRTTILQDEYLTFTIGKQTVEVGVDPDGSAPESLGNNNNLLAPANSFGAIGDYTPANTMAATFDPEANQVIQQLSQEFSTGLPAGRHLRRAPG